MFFLWELFESVWRTVFENTENTKRCSLKSENYSLFFKFSVFFVFFMFPRQKTSRESNMFFMFSFVFESRKQFSKKGTK